MPRYDYVCMVCGTRVEVAHDRHETGPALCSECGGTMRKALSLPAIVFKGSGWAKKDALAGPGSADAASAGAGSDGDSAAAQKPGDGKGADNGTAASPGKAAESKPAG